MPVMSIAGVDPSAGAGVYADLKTFQALRVYGCGVVSALTAQNPYQMFSVKEIEAEYVELQIDAILDAYDVRYIKTGMLYSTDIIKMVSRKIDEYDLKAVVDPVMTATSGGDLTKDNIAYALNKYLLPKAILTTPNIFEAEKLSNIEIKSKEDAIKASYNIACDCLITGGHLNGINTINIDGNITVEKQKLIKSNNLHGTGCNLSAAITAYLDKGYSLKDSCINSFDYVHDSIKNGNYGTLIARL